MVAQCPTGRRAAALSSAAEQAAADEESTAGSWSASPDRGRPRGVTRPRGGGSGRLSAVPRSPEQIQQEIDAARESLAATLDELAFLTSPKRLSEQGKAKVQELLQSPPGKALVAAVGSLVAFLVVRRIVQAVRD
jgi:hypothetical protein